MNLVFYLQGRLFNVIVDENRKVSFSSDMTNNKYIPFRELAEKESNKEEVELAEAIIESLPTDELVKRYIVSEFSKLGLEEVTEEE